MASIEIATADLKSFLPSTIAPRCYCDVAGALLQGWPPPTAAG